MRLCPTLLSPSLLRPCSDSRPAALFFPLCIDKTPRPPPRPLASRQCSMARTNQAEQMSMHDKARNPPNRVGTISPIGFDAAAFAAGCGPDWHTSARGPASQSQFPSANLESDDDAVAPSAGWLLAGWPPLPFPLPSFPGPVQFPPFPLPASQPADGRPASCLPLCTLSAVRVEPLPLAFFYLAFSVSCECSPYSHCFEG
ncbi:hypothetical protein B0T16DRAFT_234767 [Cercophora newfieldiana]|uniref:Uncharacterized protein n=1 Tax=Cercophora newfieldiana TaxID=92897 RepID=A0AA40CIZ5_9PEZI|nr:hypothetical protein B0T16DRAFT_234767 [Cercophora newfieldiana]